MKYVPAILFFIFLSLTGSSQRTIKGRVVNATTGTAIPSSSVFISNTSKGTISDNAGHFVLNDVSAGKHELIISCIGYETNVFSFSDEQLPLQLKIELTIKVKELQNVTVEPSVEEGWDKWGRAFMDNFVGNTANAKQCRIKNEKAIRFRYYKKTNRLTAYCDEPVLLENRALGYNISYQLENFEVNFSSRSMFYLGYSLFSPIDKEGRSKEQKWEKNREEAYNGSIMHFMRSLYADSLLEEGFEIRRMLRTPNYEKQRVRNAYLASRVVKTDAVTGKTTAKIPRDSMDYYESVMQQNDYVETYGTSLLTADSLIIETAGAFKGLSFDDYLFITYKNEKEEAGYVRTQSPERRAGLQRSYVTLLNDKLISLNKSGNFYNPQDFFCSGDWGWREKMANSLPLDYEAGK